MSQTERILGKVRKLKEQYGFIAGDDGRDYFFHWSSIRKGSTDFRKLEILDRVSFDPLELRRASDDKQHRLRAIEVELVR